MNTVLDEFNKYFLEYAKKLDFYTESLILDIIEKGTLRGIKGVPGKIKKLFKTSHEINYKDHIEMQSSFQKYTDNAVSKTINLPSNAKKDDVANAYLLAYKKGCKGVTIFRYGSKRGTLVHFPDVA